jgi:hypothetical protein
LKPQRLINRLSSRQIDFDQLKPNMKRKLSQRTRLIIISLGLALIICGLTALIYSFWPLATANLQDMVSATLFAPP